MEIFFKEALKILKNKTNKQIKEECKSLLKYNNVGPFIFKDVNKKIM